MYPLSHLNKQINTKGQRLKLAVPRHSLQTSSCVHSQSAVTGFLLGKAPFRDAHPLVFLMQSVPHRTWTKPRACLVLCPMEQSCHPFIPHGSLHRKQFSFHLVPSCLSHWYLSQNISKLGHGVETVHFENMRSRGKKIGVQGHPKLCSKLAASLGYLRLCLKNKWHTPSTQHSGSRGRHISESSRTTWSI